MYGKNNSEFSQSVETTQELPNPYGCVGDFASMAQAVTGVMDLGSYRADFDDTVANVPGAGEVCFETQQGRIPRGAGALGEITLRRPEGA
jgi:hypothetical protein